MHSTSSFEDIFCEAERELEIGRNYLSLSFPSNGEGADRPVHVWTPTRDNLGG